MHILVLYISASSSSSSSLALKCIFLNSRLLIEGQDKDAGGRSWWGKNTPASATLCHSQLPSSHPASCAVSPRTAGQGLQSEGAGSLRDPDEGSFPQGVR